METQEAVAEEEILEVVVETLEAVMGEGETGEGPGDRRTMKGGMTVTMKTREAIDLKTSLGTFLTKWGIMIWSMHGYREGGVVGLFRGGGIGVVRDMFGGGRINIMSPYLLEGAVTNL